MKKAASFLSILLILILPLTGSAQTEATADLIDFLRPLEAQVIMPLEDGILIDKGGADRVTPGDFFVVVSEEKRLTHPQTGELLDTLLEYGAVCEVTRVKQKLAYCASIDKPAQPITAAKVHRFENIPLFFEDVSGNGFAMFTALREKLPHLQWQEYVTKANADFEQNKPTLIIRHSTEQLQLLTNNKRILFSGKLNSIAHQNPPFVELAPVIPKATSGRNRLETVSAPAFKSLLPIKLSPDTEVQALKVHDLDRNGDPEIILGLNQTLVVGHLKEGVFIEQTRLALQANQQIIDISGIDLDKDGLAEIVVSALQDNEAFSAIYRYIDNKFTSITTSHLLFATFTTSDGENILLGISKASLLTPWPDFYRITLNGTQLVTEPFAIPAAQQPYGLARFTDSQGQPLLAQLTEDDHIKVTNSGGETLWTSEEHYGGTNRFITVPESGSKNAGNNIKNYLRAKLLNTSDQRLLVAKYADDSLFKNSQNYKNGQIAELRWNGFALEETANSATLNGYIADFDQTDLDNDGIQELIVAVVYKAQGFFSKPISGLVVIRNERD